MPLKVGIVMGSDSDWSTVEKTAGVLDELQVAYEVRVLSAHRTPEALRAYVRSGESRGIAVWVAAAGGAAHLAGVIAADTAAPVIGIPIQTSALGGLDSLLSMAQMPGGVPVATMAIGPAGARNAGIFAAQVLSLADSELRGRLVHFKETMAREVAEKDRRLQNRLTNPS